MTNPVFWFGLSILLLTIGLLVLVGVSIPALISFARASRSAEKLFDTLDRELPRTLEAMRHTGTDLSDLADDMTDGINSARNIARQMDQGLSDVRYQASQAQRTTRSVAAGFRAAWRVLVKKPRTKRRPKPPIVHNPSTAPSSTAPSSTAPRRTSVETTPQDSSAGAPPSSPPPVID